MSETFRAPLPDGPESFRTAPRACSMEPLPFFLGRHTDNQLVLRDNRVSRTHARIFAENGHYVIEDLNSRHGTWVNGAQIARHVLRNSDRIDFGVRESYQITFTLEPGEIHRILDQFSTSSHAGADGSQSSGQAAVFDGSRARAAELALHPGSAHHRGRRGAVRHRLRARLSDAAQGRGAGSNRGSRSRRQAASAGGSARADLGDPARAAFAPRSALHEFRSSHRAGRPARDERGGAGAAQRGLHSAGSGSQRIVGRDACEHCRGSHRRPAVSGFARAPRRSFRGQPRAAANPGHGSLHHSGKRAPDGGGAWQAAHGE